MTHEDRGRYAEKHQGTAKDKDVCDALLKASIDDKITCSAVHRIAKTFHLDPSRVGVQMDLLELRLIECQLGLFGYTPEGKSLNPVIEITSELEQMLNQSEKNGRLTCLECWEIAAKLKIKKNDVGSACEKKKLKIKPCQIGAF